jgi:16S rRNA (guanine527-N7)-methyltransferase
MKLDGYNKFIDLFEKWNRSINLSAASSRAEIGAHVEDSVHVVEHLAAAGAATVLDVGSGGGFPVVIAAMALPEVEFTALEPVHKKHAFLRTAARELGLGNLQAYAVRIEDHQRADYDVAMSRATFDLKEWLAMALERVHPGGVAIGFEAVTRTDLDPSLVRHRYQVEGKERAIVVQKRA